MNTEFLWENLLVSVTWEREYTGVYIKVYPKQTGVGMGYG
jgi:hypothetical protein